MSAETTTQAAGSHGCPVHGMGGWQGVARSGFVRSARARHGAAGKSWPGLAPRLADGWSGMAGRSRIGAAGMERRGPPGETRSGWQGAAWTLIERRGSAGRATRGRALRVLARQAWRRSDGQGPPRLGWHGDARTGTVCPGSAGVDLHCCDRMGLSWSCWHG